MKISFFLKDIRCTYRFFKENFELKILGLLIDTLVVYLFILTHSWDGHRALSKWNCTPKSGEYITYTIKIRFRISVRSLCATYHKIKDLIIIWLGHSFIHRRSGLINRYQFLSKYILLQTPYIVWTHCFICFIALHMRELITREYFNLQELAVYEKLEDQVKITADGMFIF